MTTRREALIGLGTLGLAATAGTAGAARSGPGAAADAPAPPATRAVSIPPAAPRPTPPDPGVLAREPLLHRERATHFLRAAGLDALVVTRPINVYYLTNVWPLRERQGGLGTTYAILPADPRAPVALVMSQFSYYYGVVDAGLPPGVEPWLVTRPATEAGAEPDAATPAAAPPALFRVLDPALVTPRERRRRDAIAAIREFHADADVALRRALAGSRLASGRLGTDDRLVDEALARVLPAAARAPAEDVLRTIRRVKTPAELVLQRAAAQANADAALATLRAARELGSLRGLRTRFAAEAALRGNRAVFMVVDGAHADAYDEDLRDGTALMVDCVSEWRGYHGDYARTLFVGEPPARARAVTHAIEIAWQEMCARLRPGLRYSEVQAVGQGVLARLGVDAQALFTPHSVGLLHTDEPLGLRGADALLDEGMVLSVDCPVLDQGAGGTAHLEDLVVVRAGGAEPLHAVGTPTVAV